MLRVATKKTVHGKRMYSVVPPLFTFNMLLLPSSTGRITWALPRRGLQQSVALGCIEPKSQYGAKCRPHCN